MEKSMTKITFNQFALTTVIILIFTLGSAAATLDNPQDSMSWYNKENALNKLNKFGEAIKTYDKAIEINSQYSKAWINKGIALTKLNKFDEA
jgi:tetratricopeptide (TPR) repeat protein